MARHDLRILVLRRDTEADDYGNERGGFVEAFRLYGSWRPISATKRVEAGLVADDVLGVLTVRDGAAARTITNRDRVRMLGDEYAIESVAPRDRKSTGIALTLRRTEGG